MQIHINQFKKNQNLVKALNKVFDENNVDVFINYYSEYKSDEGNKFSFSYEVYSKEGEFQFASNYIYEFDIGEFVEPIYNVIAQDFAKGDVKTY